MGSCWDNYWAGQKVCEEWKENFRMSQESFEKLCTELKLHIQKKQNHISRSNSVPIFSEPSLTVVAAVVKTFAYVLFLLQQKFSFRVYLTKQRNYFANRKSYGTSTIIEN